MFSLTSVLYPYSAKTDLVMKRLIPVIILIILSSDSLSAWGILGHEVIVAVAQRHLTPTARKNIGKYIAYDLKEDASWMDYHRNDKPISYTTHWHACFFDSEFNYSPLMHPAKARYGDVGRALQVVDANLRNNGHKHLSDSLVVFNIRMLIHFVGDMHCPVHTYFNDGFDTKWECTFKGKTYKTFHTIYDIMPEMIWGKASADDVAAALDEATPREIRKIVSGTLYDWLKDAATRSHQIYEWNPAGAEVIREDTVELSRELTNLQMRNAGYRLAYLLNQYFGQ